MFTTRPPHGYSPQLLSELGTAELFVPVREHEPASPRFATVPVPTGSSLLH